MYKISILNLLQKRTILTVALLFIGFTSFAQALVGGTVYPVNGQVNNAPVSFRTIREAIAHITTTGNGLSGNGQVVLELTSTYDPALEFEEPNATASITIPNIATTSATLGITIRPGVGVTKTLSANIGTGGGGGTIFLNGAQYITIDGRQGGTGAIGLTIVNTSNIIHSTYTYAAVKLTNANNNTITYTNLQASGRSATYSAVVYFSSGSNTTNSENNTISYNNITSSSEGRVTNAIANLSFHADRRKNANNTISNNEIHNFSLAGINLNTSLGAGDGWQITNNTIHDGVGTDVTGINATEIVGTATISNNIISDLNGTGTLMGINVQATIATIISNNTITSISGATTTGINTLSAATIISKNRINNITGTGIVAAIYIQATTGTTAVLANKIRAISTSGANVAVYPIRIATNTDAARVINIVNNVVSVSDAISSATGANRHLMGVSISGIGTVNLYYNTIHIANTVEPSSAYACYAWTSGLIINVTNSILSANVTDKNTLITGTAGVTINRSYSLFVYRTTGGTAYNTNNNETFSYGEAGRPGNPSELFASLTDLTIQPDFITSLVGTKGTPILPYTTDIEGVDRAATPSIGAHDYSERVLPVTITSFNAKLNNNRTLFDWTVGTESNVNRYEVERLQADGSYYTIAKVIATGASSYNATDVNPLTGDNYYRLKSIDNDGTVGYFVEVKHVKIAIATEKKASIYPNPVIGDKINVALTNYPEGQYSYKIVNAAGNTIAQGKFTNNGSGAVTLYEPLAKGVYVLHIVNGANIIQSKLIKN